MKIRRGNSRKKETIMNEKIRNKEVRLIDENGEQAGVVETSVALRRAEDLDLDLVLVYMSIGFRIIRISCSFAFRVQ